MPLFVMVPHVRLERAKDPGLGVRDLHAQGVTGAGVSVATVYVPAHHRTLAGHHHPRHYRYDAEGGDSEWPPYLARVELARALAGTGDTAVVAGGSVGVRR